jgi:hypothetical protein
MSQRLAADVPWSRAAQQSDRTARPRTCATRDEARVQRSLQPGLRLWRAHVAWSVAPAGDGRRRPAGEIVGRHRPDRNMAHGGRSEALPAVKSALCSLLSSHAGLTGINRGDLGPMCQCDSNQSPRMVRRPCRRSGSQGHPTPGSPFAGPARLRAWLAPRCPSRAPCGPRTCHGTAAHGAGRRAFHAARPRIDRSGQRPMRPSANQAISQSGRQSRPW